MPKVICICGKLCSGKSTYARMLCNENKAVILSVDELTLSLFEHNIGDKHDEYTEKIKKYLFNKSLEIIDAGADVILDWGFWTRKSRIAVKEFYNFHQVRCEMYYIDICCETWKMRVDKRNCEILTKKTNAYYADDNLKKKFESIFEQPDKNEVDVWIKQ